MAIGDVDRDGLPDVVSTRPSQLLIYRSWVVEPGTLTVGATIDVPGADVRVALADVDGDGWLDLFAPSTGAVWRLDSATVHFEAAYRVLPSLFGLARGSGPWDLFDLDRDGRLDQLVWRNSSGVFLMRGR
jgi:hypothetical protein